MSNSSLPPEILDLSVPERVALVEQVWDSMAEDEARLQLTEAQKAELDRRRARRDSSGSEAVDWAEVKRRIIGES